MSVALLQKGISMKAVSYTHLINLRTYEFHTSDLIRPLSEKFGIGMYYDDANPNFLDLLETAALLLSLIHIWTGLGSTCTGPYFWKPKSRMTRLRHAGSVSYTHLHGDEVVADSEFVPEEIFADRVEDDSPHVERDDQCEPYGRGCGRAGAQRRIPLRCAAPCGGSSRRLRRASAAP